jgi:YVTN family beta-propeller protein
MRLSGRIYAPRALLRIPATALALVLAAVFAACGNYYRPVAQPIEGAQPSPGAAHTVISINTDGVASNYSGNGSATNIDVSGDSIQGNLTVGLVPTHAALTPDGTKLYVANSADDTVTANTTSSPATVAATVQLPVSAFASIASVTGDGATATYTYTGGTGIFSAGDTVFITGCATVGFDGVYVVTAASGNSFSVANPTSGADNPEFAGAQAKTPNAVFVGTADDSNVYVVGYATNSVYAIGTSSNAVNTVVPVGTHPVALAQLPNQQQLYVVNQGSGNLSVIDTAANNTVIQTIALPAGAVPVWAVARADSTHAYVLDENGTIYDVNPQTFAVTSIPSVGAGANYLSFDPVLNRLYVTNPTNSEVGIFDASAAPPKLMNIINLSTAPGGACVGCAPTAITTLGDGSRAYVAAYQFAPGCTDPAGNAVNCVESLVGVIDGPSATLKSIISPVTSGAALSTTGCGAASGPVPALWQPGSPRFRVSIASSGGGTNSNFKVYVGGCDAGSIAVIDTYPTNGNVADVYSGVSLPAPLSTFPGISFGVPPPENPVFVLAGP